MRLVIISSFKYWKKRDGLKRFPEKEYTGIYSLCTIVYLYGVYQPFYTSQGIDFPNESVS